MYKCAIVYIYKRTRENEELVNNLRSLENVFGVWSVLVVRTGVIKSPSKREFSCDWFFQNARRTEKKMKIIKIAHALVYVWEGFRVET